MCEIVYEYGWNPAENHGIPESRDFSWIWKLFMNPNSGQSLANFPTVNTVKPILFRFRFPSICGKQLLPFLCWNGKREFLLQTIKGNWQLIFSMPLNFQGRWHFFRAGLSFVA
jgi:hypothetical protein